MSTTARTAASGEAGDVGSPTTWPITCRRTGFRFHAGSTQTWHDLVAEQ